MVVTELSTARESRHTLAATLSDATELIRRYMVLPAPEAADAITLWCACTHALPALPFATRLAITSALPQCGKSRLLDLVAALSHDPLVTANATTAAVMKTGSLSSPSLVINDILGLLSGPH